MKIVQIAVAADPENGEALYGLDSEGSLYLYHCTRVEPRRCVSTFADRDGKLITGTEHGVDLYKAAQRWVYQPGYTKGWELLTDPVKRLDLSTKLFHPEDPEH